MTNTEDAIGIEFPGPHTKISTGAGVITSKKWYKERLPIGDMVHIGLEKTANTVSARQANAEHGIATSWMESAETPASKPGVCVLHKAGGSDGSSSSAGFDHIVWEGTHSVIVPSIVQNTPEIHDSQVFKQITGPACATEGCKCSLPKLSSLLAERCFPAVEPQEQDAGGPVAEHEQAEADPYAVEARKHALHSLSGTRCSCHICSKAKQRRDFSERGSHPHSETTYKNTPGLHSFNDSPSYFDTIDYGPN